MTLDVITFVVAFGVALLLYPPAIRTLRRLRSGQVIQEELPDSHQRKAGTPTGGGILFVSLAILGGLLATLAGHPGALPALAGLVAGVLIGFADDPSAASEPSTYRWTPGSNLTGVPGMIVKVAGDLTVTSFIAMYVSLPQTVFVVMGPPT